MNQNQNPPNEVAVWVERQSKALFAATAQAGRLAGELANTSDPERQQKTLSQLLDTLSEIMRLHAESTRKILETEISKSVLTIRCGMLEALNGGGK